MTDGKSTLPLDLFIATILAQALSPKPDQMNQGTGEPKAAEPAPTSGSATGRFSGSNPTFILLDELFDATKDDLTYGEELIGYDPEKDYDPAIKEMLQDFANAIDILNNGKGSTPPAIRATETAIGHIQIACFWAQNALPYSKF